MNHASLPLSAPRSALQILYRAAQDMQAVVFIGYIRGFIVFAGTANKINLTLNYFTYDG